MRTFVSSILLVATMLSLVNASLNDIDEQHQRRRDLLLRGVAGENRADHDRQLGSDDKQKDRSFDVTQLQDELGEVLYLYQMDTTYIYAASPHDDHDNDHYADPVTQPFYKPLEHGASGVLAYRSAGWEFLYTFVGRNLRPGASYELIYYPSIADPALLNITCIASGVVGNIVSAFLNHEWFQRKRALSLL